MADDPTMRGDGVLEWRDDQGRLHREGAPACVYVNGTEKWYRNGLRHRNGGPAAIYPDGRRIWFEDGRKVKEERARG
jgi:hypothetical protein